MNGHNNKSNIETSGLFRVVNAAGLPADEHTLDIARFLKKRAYISEQKYPGFSPIFLLPASRKKQETSKYFKHQNKVSCLL
jgi:hypothetical protein